MLRRSDHAFCSDMQEGSFDLNKHRYAIEPESRTLNDIAEMLERRTFGEGTSDMGQLHKVYRIESDGSTLFNIPQELPYQQNKLNTENTSLK